MKSFFIITLTIMAVLFALQAVFGASLFGTVMSVVCGSIAMFINYEIE